MEGAPHTAKDQLVCLWGAPSPYIEEGKRGPAGLKGRAHGRGGILLLLGVGIPPLGAPLEAGPPPPPLLYIRGKGHPIDAQVDL